MKLLLTIFLFAISFYSNAQNIVEFRGFNRSGHYHAKDLSNEWPEGGPEVILKIEDIGKGYSQPIFAEGKLYITGLKEDTLDFLSSYDFNGTLLWRTSYGSSWTRSYTDSRSTPTYQDGRLYVSSGTGKVSCIDASSGEIIWQVDAINNYRGQIHRHGDAECPLIVDDLVVFTTGGDINTMVAFNKFTGKLRWKTASLGGAKSYASPVLINHHGQNIILVQTTKNIIAIEPAGGEILWSYDLIQYHLKSQGKGANTNPPIYSEGHIFVTSGYDHSAVMLSLSENGNSVQLKWRNDILDTHHGGVVLVDDNLYGSNWQHNSKGRWASIAWDTGKTNWEEEWNNKGSIICADGMLYFFEEKRGNVALVQPSVDSLKIISNFRVEEGEGPYWSHPAIYDKKLFIRHGNVLMVYNLKN